MGRGLQKRKHKVTWVSSNCTVENQIDHHCISRNFGRTLLDVRGDERSRSHFRPSSPGG